jgi:hypothetical protein
LLYHLKKPELALEFMAAHCTDLLLLETCVSYRDEDKANFVNEPAHDFTQAFHGTGCRPTRSWIWQKLNSLFPYVYVPKTQPDHEEFPLNWDTTINKMSDTKLSRAVFIASRYTLNDNPLLLNELPLTYQIMLR